MDRVAQLLSTTQRSSRILEIGPSHAPIAPKAGGWNSFVVDHATQAELRAKYRGFGVNLEAIEPVDFVWTAGGLADAVPEAFHGSFDTLIASHVIEHVPDFVGFFAAAGKLLKPTGTVALAVPDKRFCFDYFQSVSMAGEMIDAHMRGAVRHSRGTAFNYCAHIVMADGVTAWGQHPVREFALLHPFAQVAKALQEWSDDPGSDYRDYHAWQFSPASFALVALELAMAGLLDFHLVTAYPTAGSEFIVLLQPGAPRFAMPELADEARLDLMKRTLADERERLDYVLGPPPPVELKGEAAAQLRRLEERLPALAATMERANERVVAALEGLPRPDYSALLAELARLVHADGQARDRIVDSLHEIVTRLGAQDTALHEIAEVAFWQRRALRPARWAWGKMRPVRRLFRGNGAEAP